MENVTAKAWYCIGFDDGTFRIKGGRATYQAVMYNCHNNGRLVKLARLEVTQLGLQEISRYVEPDTVLEFIEIKGNWKPEEEPTGSAP